MGSAPVDHEHGGCAADGLGGRGRGAGRCHARGGPGAPRPHRDAVGPDGQRRRGGVSQSGVGGRARQCPWRRRGGARCAPATANRALRQQGPAAGGAVGTAIGAGRWHHARGARQLVGGGGGADRGDQPPQRARTPAPGAVPELLGRRSGPDQRALQFLAFPLRRPRGHAHGSAHERAQGRCQRAQRLPDRAGLQLRPSRAARGQAPARPAAPGRAHRRRGAAPDGAHQGLHPLCHQDQGQWGAGRHHRQLGQRPDAAGACGARSGV